MEGGARSAQNPEEHDRPGALDGGRSQAFEVDRLNHESYNYKRNLYNWESVQRTYALNDVAALVICDYANRPRPENPLRISPK